MALLSEWLGTASNGADPSSGQVEAAFIPIHIEEPDMENSSPLGLHCTENSHSQLGRTELSVKIRPRMRF